MSTNFQKCFFKNTHITSYPRNCSLLCALLYETTRDQTARGVAILNFYLYLLLHYLYLLRVLLYAGTGDQTALGDLSSSPAAIGILSAANVTLHYFTHTNCHRTELEQKCYLGSPIYVHSSYLSPPTAVVYFFQDGAPFCKENAKFWAILAILLRILTHFGVLLLLNDTVVPQNIRYVYVLLHNSTEPYLMQRG